MPLRGRTTQQLSFAPIAIGGFLDPSLFELDEELRQVDELITQLNKKLVKHLIKKKTIRPRKIRIDSTTVKAHITYPNDVGLIHSVVRALTRTSKSLCEKITSHVRATKKRLAQVGATLKSSVKNKKQQTQKALREALSFAKDTVMQSKTIVKKWSKRVHQLTPKQQRNYRQLTDYVQTSEQILEQTKQKLRGVGSKLQSVCLNGNIPLDNCWFEEHRG